MRARTYVLLGFHALLLGNVQQSSYNGQALSFQAMRYLQAKVFFDQAQKIDPIITDTDIMETFINGILVGYNYEVVKDYGIHFLKHASQHGIGQAQYDSFLLVKDRLLNTCLTTSLPGHVAVKKNCRKR